MQLSIGTLHIPLKKSSIRIIQPKIQLVIVDKFTLSGHPCLDPHLILYTPRGLLSWFDLHLILYTLGGLP